MKLLLHVSLFLFLSLEALATESIEKMIGQMVMIGFEGKTPQETLALQNAIQAERVGGVLLLGRNIEGSSQLQTLTQTLSQKATTTPLLIAIDQEGGRVARLHAKNGFTDFPSAKEVASTLSLEEARALYRDMALTLKGHGINYNLAPVVDLENTHSPIIGKIGRSFSPHATTTSVYAQAFVDVFEEEGILTALKHFPGHGNARTDSHTQLTDVTQAWEFEELRPYFDFIQMRKARSIMVAHVYLKRFDADFPASLSPALVQELLREQMGFDEVVISDDMLMKGVASTFDFKERIVRSINAGVDILIVSDFYVDGEATHERIIAIVTEALASGAIELQTIENAYSRIVAFKKELE